MTQDAHLLPVAILAGGRATRLRPATDRLPKALMDVNGRPFIAWQLEALQAQGALRVIICVGHLGEDIRRVVADEPDFGLHVDWAFDGPTLLGTAGAIRRALPLIGGPFFVLYGDSYLPIDWYPVQEAFLASGKPGLMTVYRNEDRWDRSNVEFDGQRIVAYDKNAQTSRMHHIDYGLGAFHPSAFARLVDGRPTDLAELYGDLTAEHLLAAYEVHQRFFEIGSFDGLEETRAFLASRRRQEEGRS